MRVEASYSEAAAFTIASPASVDDLDALKRLFVAYAHEVEARYDISLCFQNFDEEMRSFPAVYADGRMLLARDAAGAPVGGVAAKPIAPGVIEMKRLTVADAARGRGLGRKLCEELIQYARDDGYREMKLDTIRRMTAANRLYATLGFTDCANYNGNRIPDCRHMCLTL